MVAPKVHIQELFLPESLLTLVAGVWLLPSMGALVHDHVTLLLARRTQSKLNRVSNTVINKCLYAELLNPFHLLE